MGCDFKRQTIVAKKCGVCVCVVKRCNKYNHILFVGTLAPVLAPVVEVKSTCERVGARERVDTDATI